MFQVEKLCNHYLMVTLIFCHGGVQCLHEDGKSEHRVCIFKDIILWEGQLLYIAKGDC